MPPSHKSSAPAPGQLGLDFSDIAQPSPASEPPALASPKRGSRPPEASPESIAAMEAAGWLPPRPILAARGHIPSNALALACSAKDASLVEMLLALPISWNLDERYAPEASSPQTNLTPLAHLLTGDSNSKSSKRPNSMNATQVGLAMVARGASFVVESEDGQCALSIAARQGNQTFIQALAGHPDFDYQRLSNLRLGTRHLVEQDGQAPIDARIPLLGSLISRNLMEAAEALILHAGFPINEIDVVGRLPISYIPHDEALESLLAWGADPSLPDARGLNAMAHAQRISDTSVREKVIGILATAMRKGAASNPDALAELQRQNLPALLNAAGSSTKSSMLKILSAFKFVASEARDPKTLMTPLMLAIRGSRLASARHLIDLGCSINDANANGTTAAAYLIGASASPNGPNVDEILALVQDDIDMSIVSKKGWPVALEGAFQMARNPHDSGYGYSFSPSNAATRISRLLSRANGSASPSLVAGTNGATLAEAYASGKPQSYQRFAALLEFYKINAHAKTPQALDRAIASMIKIHPGPTGYNQQQGFQAAMATLATELSACPVPLAHTAAALAASISEIPSIVAIKLEIAKNFPAIASGVETHHISQAMDSAAEQQSARRSSGMRL